MKNNKIKAIDLILQIIYSHKKYKQSNWDEMHIRKCENCGLIYIQVLLRKNNGFLKIKG